MSFDTKINNENMTKCLQSLKEMYQDLATKGVYCPNEAEFRQYNVLVKLNDGDILRYGNDKKNETKIIIICICHITLSRVFWLNLVWVGSTKLL